MFNYQRLLINPEAQKQFNNAVFRRDGDKRARSTSFRWHKRPSSCPDCKSPVPLKHFIKILINCLPIFRFSQELTNLGHTLLTTAAEILQQHQTDGAFVHLGAPFALRYRADERMADVIVDDVAEQMFFRVQFGALCHHGNQTDENNKTEHFRNFCTVWMSIRTAAFYIPLIIRKFAWNLLCTKNIKRKHRV